MVEITFIMSVDENISNLDETINSIFNQSIKDIELICIPLSKEVSSKLSNYSKTGILIESYDDLIKNLNNSIKKAQGNYILFVDSFNILKKFTLEKFCNKLNETSADLLLFNNDNNNSMKLLSRLTGQKVFNYTNIKEYLFEIDINLNNILFKKNYLLNNEIYFDKKSNGFSDLFSYKSFLNANLIYFNESVYKSTNSKDIIKDYDYYENYVKNQNFLHDYIVNYDQLLFNQSINFKIQQLINEYELLSMDSKKESFNLLRNEFLLILNKSDSEETIKVLNKDNRKSFEQIIISETVEEYDLLKRVYDDKKYIYYMQRYEKILKTEEKKIKQFNKSLVSSNSWKLTRIFRINHE